MRDRSRQARARQRWLAVTVLCGSLALSAGTQQLAAHGWSAFVFRGPGIGATASDDTKNDAAASQAAPAPKTEAVMPDTEPAPDPDPPSLELPPPPPPVRPDADRLPGGPPDAHRLPNERRPPPTARRFAPLSP